MPLLRLTQSSLDDDRYRVEIAYESDKPRQTAQADVTFRLTPQDEADLRWYLEDYLQWPHEPAPKIAARVVERMKELGTELFTSIFDADRKSRRLWNAVEEALPETRVEIVTSVEEATSIPWELLREPDAEAPVALLAHSFVRAQPDARRGARTVTDDAGPVRILLAICRPGQADDVPFRSVATRILKGLDQSSREAFQLDVLRPPTFDDLARKLRDARDAGRPYHVLHFDDGRYPTGIDATHPRFVPPSRLPYSTSMITTPRSKLSNWLKSVPGCPTFPLGGAQFGKSG